MGGAYSMFPAYSVKARVLIFETRYSIEHNTLPKLPISKAISSANVHIGGRDNQKNSEL